jgi:hypothetical protein
MMMAEATVGERLARIEGLLEGMVPKIEAAIVSGDAAVGTQVVELRRRVDDQGSRFGERLDSQERKWETHDERIDDIRDRQERWRWTAAGMVVGASLGGSSLTIGVLQLLGG